MLSLLKSPKGYCAPYKGKIARFLPAIQIRGLGFVS